uniref:Uncharacterized protein n=1 Tax=Glossina pallidipes TaxID=7398 RepID=A0A1A9ZV74_GLOPL
MGTLFESDCGVVVAMELEVAVGVVVMAIVMVIMMVSCSSGSGGSGSGSGNGGSSSSTGSSSSSSSTVNRANVLSQFGIPHQDSRLVLKVHNFTTFQVQNSWLAYMKFQHNEQYNVHTHTTLYHAEHSPIQT